MIGKALVLLAVIINLVGSLIADWNTTHVFNPHWPPHARFHEVGYLAFEVGITVMALWLLFRRSREPEVAVAVAAAIPVIKLGAFLVAESVPGAHFQDTAGQVPLYFGIPANLLHPGLNALLAVTGYVLYRFELRRGESATASL